MSDYVPMIRPASMVTLPAGVQWQFVEAPWDLPHLPLPRAATRYGVIRTERPLTHEECQHFALRPK